MREEKCKAYNVTCRHCSRVGHLEKCCRSKVTDTFDKNKVSGAANSVKVRDDEKFEFFTMTVPSTKRRIMETKPRTLLHHAVNDFGKWRARKPEQQPEVSVSVSICMSGYNQLNIPEPRTQRHSKTCSLPDTGAQMVIGGVWHGSRPQTGCEKNRVHSTC